MSHPIVSQEIGEKIGERSELSNRLHRLRLTYFQDETRSIKEKNAEIAEIEARIAVLTEEIYR